MRAIFFLTCIISLSLTAYSQDCHVPVLNYNPKEVVGNYSMYEFTPGKIKDSVLLKNSSYDSIHRIQMKVRYRPVHSMASTYKDPGIEKIQLDSNGHVVSQKTYAEGETYNGRYKYIGLDECTYTETGYLLSESMFASANIPITFAYSDSSFDGVIKQNYSHRATPDCMSRYHYKDSLIIVIENYMDGALTFKNLLSYTSGVLTGTKAYKPDGTMFSSVEFNYSSKGFTQTLYYYSGQSKAVKKEEVSYYFKYTKEKGKIVEVEYGKNGIMIDKNKYVYDSKGRIAVVKMYDEKSLKYIHKYFYL